MAGVTFLPDSCRLLLSGEDGLVLADLADGSWRLDRPADLADQYSLSRDGRTLVIEHPVLDVDVWLMEFARPSGSETRVFRANAAARRIRGVAMYWQSPSTCAVPRDGHGRGAESGAYPFPAPDEKGPVTIGRISWVLEAR